MQLSADEQCGDGIVGMTLDECRFLLVHSLLALLKSVVEHNDRVVLFVDHAIGGHDEFLASLCECAVVFLLVSTQQVEIFLILLLQFASLDVYKFVHQSFFLIFRQLLV